MNTYRAIFGDQLTETPKKQVQKTHSGYNSHLGWVFVCQTFNERPKALRTYHSLFGASENYTYYTPNTFYRNDQRHSGALRWLNAMVVDVDVKNGANEGLILPDVLERITVAGLPAPSLIIGTPSGGFHIYWHFNSPKRAFPAVTDHYARVQRSIAEAIGGDGQAVGAERWFRLPTAQNTLFTDNTRVSFDELCDWLTLYREERQSLNKGICVGTKGLLQHPAVLTLLEGVSEGQRDHTCYTLALAYKASGYDKTEAEAYLQEWNQRNSPAMTQMDVKRKVKSAFKPGAPKGPSAHWIRTLSGKAFTYQNWEEAKSREERTYSHLEEWQRDIITYIKRQGGRIVGSQRAMAKAITSSSDGAVSIPYATFKKAIAALIKTGIITKTVTGKGRAAETTLEMTPDPKVVFFPTEKTKKKNGLNSNTFIDLVVGGNTLSLVQGRSRYFLSRGDPLLGVRTLFPF